MLPDDADDAVGQNVVELTRRRDHEVLAEDRIGKAEDLRHDAGAGPRPRAQGPQRHRAAPSRPRPPDGGAQPAHPSGIRGGGGRRHLCAVERGDDGERSPPAGGAFPDGAGGIDDFRGRGAGTAIQLLGLPGAQGGHVGQCRPGAVHTPQGDVVGQNQPEAAAGQKVHGRSGAAESIECSGPAVVDGRA